MAKYKEIEMPDGSIAEFPDSMSDLDISKAIQRTYGDKGQKKVRFDKPESLKDKVLRYGLKNPIAGTGKTLDKIQNLPLNLLSGLSPQIAEANKKYKEADIDYDKAFGLPDEKNWGDVLSQMPAEFAMAAALPAANLGRFGQLLGNIPKGGKYLQKIMAEAIPQAGLAGALSEQGGASDAAVMAGATQAPFSAVSQLAMSSKPQYQKLASKLGGLFGGAGAGYALNEMGAPGEISGLGAAIAGGLGAKFLGTKAMMMQEQAGGKNLSQAEKRLQMARRLNLDFLTPEEAFNSPFLARKQGRLGRTEEGSELMYDKFQKRVDSEQNAINRLLKQIHDPEVMGPKAAELYKKSYSTKVPNDVMAKFANNKIIHEAIKKIETTPAYQHSLKDVPLDSIAYMDHVKQAMDDMIEGAPKKEAAIIRNVKNSLIEDLDKLSPEYKQARGLEERKFARQGLEEAFDKSNIRSGHAFYKALNSAEDFDKLMHNLRNVPVARAKLKAMRELFKDFRKESTINKVRGLEQVGMKQDRNTVNAALSLFEDMFTGGKFDKEAIEFITSKDWNKQLADINKITDKQKRMAKTIEVFGKIAAQANARKEDEDKKSLSIVGNEK